MSQHEIHPLDERFRTVLGQAERTPPPAVWAAVQAERKGRRAGWIWRGWVLLAGLVLLFGGVSAYHLISGRNARKSGNTTLASSRPAPIPGMDNGVAPERHTLSSDPLGSRAMREGATSGGWMAPTNERTAMERYRDTSPPQKHDTNVDTGPQDLLDGARSTTEVQERHTAPPQGGNAQEVVALTGDPEATPLVAPGAEEGPQRSVVDATWLHPLSPNSAGPANKQPYWRQLPEHRYVIRNGNWWLGATLGAYTLQDEWRGTDERLVEALNNSDAPIGTWALGLELGRQWNSGWSIRGGLHLERSEQQLSHQDRRVFVEQEITTYYVTLNTQIFLSNVDTVTTVTTEDRSTSGNVQRSMLRVPLEIGHQWGLGRWTIGLQGGFAMEWTRAQGSSLMMIDGEGSLASLPAAPSLLRSRYPTQLLGVAGLRGGYLINEHWLLWAGPNYMNALLALGTEPIAYASQQRWGLLFGISRSINCKHDP